VRRALLGTAPEDNSIFSSVRGHSTACDGLDSKPRRDKLQRSVGSGVLRNAGLYESGYYEGGSLQYRHHDKPLEKTHAGLANRHHSRRTINGRLTDRDAVLEPRRQMPHQSMHRDSCSHTTKVRTPADWARSSHFRNKSCRDYLNPYNAHTVSRADSPRISLTSHSFLAVYYRAWHPIFSFILPSVSPSLLSLSLQPERCICTVRAETLASAAPNSVACVNGSAASRLGHLESPSARLAHWHVSLAC
jgi:hypothetical protein